MEEGMAMPELAFEAFLEVDMRVGRILRVRDGPRPIGHPVRAEPPPQGEM